jgi:hypothetical protein
MSFNAAHLPFPFQSKKLKPKPQCQRFMAYKFIKFLLRQPIFIGKKAFCVIDRGYNPLKVSDGCAMAAA